MIDQIVARFRVLVEQPRMGRSRDEIAPALRSSNVSSYIIFYRCANEGIDIVRVLNGFRDITSQFDRD